MKQETLEETKLRQLFKNRSNCYADVDDVVQAMDENCFIETINEWQKEQDKKMYSEEEVIAIVEKSRKTGLTAEYLLLTEQFKKK